VTRLTSRCGGGWRQLVVLSALFLSLGCNAARVFVASPGDYAEYRRVRLGHGLGERLAAARDYLRRYPTGRYAERVRRYYQYAEPLYYSSQEEQGVAGIEEYLRQLPRSDRSKAASELLAQLRTEQRREAAPSRRVKALTGRLSQEKKARAGAARLPLDWTLWLSDKAAFDRPFSKVPTRLLVPYRLQLPQPVCSKRSWGRRCKKTLMRRFRMRVGSKGIDQEIAIDVWVDLDASWRLRSARIAGQDLLLLSHEAHVHSEVDEDDEGTEAMLRESFFRRLMPELLRESRDCSRSQNRLRCGAIVVELEQGDDEDRIMIFRGKRPADDEDSDEDSDEDESDGEEADEEEQDDEGQDEG
jgi:hypothetical protein